MLYDHFRSENRSLDPVAVLLEAIEQRQIFYFSRLFHTISLKVEYIIVQMDQVSAVGSGSYPRYKNFFIKKHNSMLLTQTRF